MKLLKSTYRLLCLLPAMTLAIGLPTRAQGLSFNGQEKPISERSSYQVFTKSHLPLFADKVEISFEYSPQNIESSGYILLLKDQTTGKAYNLAYLYQYGDNSFIFSEDGKKAFHAVKFSDDELKARRWIPVSLRLHTAEDKAFLKIGNDSTCLRGIGLQKGFRPMLYFGMHDYILETASFALKNLQVGDGKRTWRMPLDESAGELVHDSGHKAIGRVKNPIWLIGRSYHWKRLFTYYSSSPTGVAYDGKTQKFYIYNTDSLHSYEPYTGLMQAATYRNGPYFKGRRSLGMNFMDSGKSMLYTYELAEANDVWRLSLRDAEWTRLSEDSEPRWLCLHHHCGAWLPEKNTYLLFGGYGNRRYSNAFLTYHTDKAQWDTLYMAGDRMAPRFFTGIALTPDHKTAYLYGGKGNEAGDQNIGVQYYYDLYRADLEKHTVKKLWEQESPKTNRIAARDMLLSADGQHIYFLGYPEYMPRSNVQLYRMRVADGQCQALGDSIPLVSEEIATNVNLYHDEKRGELYCCTQEFSKGEKTAKVSLWSLQMPPAALSALTPHAYVSGHSVTSWAVAAGMAIVLAALAIWRMAARRRTRDSITSASRPPETGTSRQTTPEPHFKDRNAIFLFGTFSMLDRKGRDICYMFSPKLRLIFLYMLLYCTKHEEGLPSTDMNALFWPDKAGDKVKNLKGVTINHLRKILQELDGVRLVNDKGHFTLTLDNDCYCDYSDFGQLAGGGTEDLPADTAKTLRKICLRGKFLNGEDNELLDTFKHRTEEAILSLAMKETDKAYQDGQYHEVLLWNSVLAYVDPLNEQGLFYAVCACRKAGKPEEALRLYNAFVRRYKAEMREDYPYRYEHITTELLLSQVH